MRSVDTFVNEQGKIYINIVDTILLVKDTIVQAKEKKIDTEALETLFIWLGSEHTKAEEQVNEALRMREHKRTTELQNFWHKYKEGNGSASDQPHPVSEKDSH